MTRLLVLGGARSGKSRYAQKRIEACGARLAYIATAEARDDEMVDRIAQHRRDRGPRWQTIEAPLDLPRAIETASRDADALLVDCLTLWLSNLMLADHDIPGARDALIRAVGSCSVPLALVANEVGLGIVPDNALARRFRDEAGWLNQTLADAADEVVFLAAGLPMQLKGRR
ncbi:bifunctional adenosylcobinamide kinase/adenosylcobinamide-phosphate guanylyltransferase [Novosphingobium sp. KCTC 2891]|uniref:bifunctional adenosylcobinamide kinase/adenosylcobinamide-phosphate guanylyltransferase n=1 Tax=Novosphingobium sp. KCTC 2891 TaxID=2989730 RepID=UPI002223CBF6|nr:bifunctional adenosylcobinamide kinase/adenosylcobinamide-phosphate guanylyltransferase [Novosphingobium sp. KCTC 2891]MCW1383730.1 bifunctional adenosylcobinamide kinase/adenosylcobinamide-phosphate guanylyltransferase [Novosphingobium sp. KCTC 2891]